MSVLAHFHTVFISLSLTLLINGRSPECCSPASIFDVGSSSDSQDCVGIDATLILPRGCKSWYRQQRSLDRQFRHNPSLVLPVVHAEGGCPRLVLPAKRPVAEVESSFHGFRVLESDRCSKSVSTRHVCILDQRPEIDGYSKHVSTRRERVTIHEVGIPRSYS